MLHSALRGLLSSLAPAGAKSRLSTLIFHRVLSEPDPVQPGEVTGDEFERLLQWIGRLFHVLPIDEAIERFQGGTLPSRPLVITFDDGYADNQQLAAPILQQLGMSATFFVASGYLDGGRMFNDTVISALRGCRRQELDLTELELGSHRLVSIEDRQQAVAKLLPAVKRLPTLRRDIIAERISELAEVVPPNDLMMTSSQVAGLARRGFEVGAHTVSHPILARVDESVAIKEIQSSRERLEKICNAPVRFFAYPNGRPGDDYTTRTVTLVKDLGFDAAFTTACGVAAASTDRFQLPRFTPWDRTELKFAWRLARNLANVNPALDSKLG